MAKQLKLAAQVRTTAGRSAVKKIKQQGLVPAVIYGATHAPQMLQVNAREFSNLLSHATGEHLLVELEITGEGKSEKNLALIQEVQHEPLKGSVLHVDFHAVSADEKIHAEIPVEPVQVEALRVEHTTDPAHHVLVLFVRPIGKNLQKQLVATRATDIFGWTGVFAGKTYRQ